MAETDDDASAQRLLSGGRPLRWSDWAAAQVEISSIASCEEIGPARAATARGSMNDVGSLDSETDLRQPTVASEGLGQNGFKRVRPVYSRNGMSAARARSGRLNCNRF